MSKQSIQDYVTIITGASSGMGQAIAHRFAEEKSKVVLAARRKDRLDKIADEIKQKGGTALVVPCDVSDAKQVQNLIDQTNKEFGRIDVMVNNAGFGTIKTVQESTIEDIDSQIDVNFKGLCYGCHAVLNTMTEQKSGHIINIGSIASIRHFPSFAIYTGAKHAVLGFSRSLYEEVREKGIRVSVICPAAVNTEWLDVAGLDNPPWKPQDMLQADDIAEMALTCVQMPKNVQIDTMVAWPTCQAT